MLCRRADLGILPIQLLSLFRNEFGVAAFRDIDPGQNLINGSGNSRRLSINQAISRCYFDWPAGSEAAVVDVLLCFGKRNHWNHIVGHGNFRRSLMILDGLKQLCRI